MSMKLLVLGLLIEKNRHPYDIRQTIKGRNWHVAFKIRDGSLYYAVDQMRADGLIEAAEVIPVPGDNRPDKTIYRITEKGKASFLELLQKQMNQTAYPEHPIFSALPFVSVADKEKTMTLLGRQLAACKARIELMREVAERKEGALPRGSVHLIRGILRFSEVEKEWLEEIIAEAESGLLFEPKPLEKS
ncbi:PadR family transcriptional regulator [Paenibacillus nanensis]|uniref:PadR family transcriptional regulator n=1 Tax=Paenibacillus nanensis TaxID=393251 RepID=A0A3A1V0N9_9BACL|nr:PadR family transcriptional regulator [Paenibacillus nanensis]RIX53002.1 PadR family transcriptional regulator [Paenibacillus nanensis]